MKQHTFAPSRPSGARSLATLFAIALAAGLGRPGAAWAQGSYVNFEGRQARPICLSPDGTRLFAVNTPAARLSVFDVVNPSNPILVAEIPVGVEPVSVQARDDDEVWVVNEVSDSVSIVSVSRGLVIDTLSVKDEPADVVFAQGRAFVTAARNRRIAVFDVNTRALLTNITVFGECPRALAVDTNTAKIYAAFALSGNRTTLVPPDSAPAQPPPTNPLLPAPPQVSLIVDATDPTWSGVVNPNMPDNDVVEIDAVSLAITRYFPRVGTVNLALAVRPGSGDLYVANTDARNLTRFEPVLKGNFVTNRVTRVTAATGALTHFDLNAGFVFSGANATANRSNALAQPTAVVFGSSGSFLFVAAFGSDRVAKVDANSGAVLGRIELQTGTVGAAANARTKRGTRGLALGVPGSQRLYALNRIANTISVCDIAGFTVVREIPVGSHDPTPSDIRQGRGFLYDAKLSGHGTVSCASCHIDGDNDMIAWDLGNPGGNLETNFAKISASGLVVPGGFGSNFVMHPMKGPMTTQTLRGLRGLDPLHWRGDRTNFLHFNGAFDGLLGGAVLPAADMEAYRSFINTMVFDSNPNQNLDRTLPASLQGANPIAGRNAYINTNYTGSGSLGFKCNLCHALPAGTDRSLTPASLLQESQSFKVPQLRNIYQKMNFARTGPSIGGFGIVHDGEDPSIFEFLSRPVFDTFSRDAVVKSNVSAFVLCFDTGTAPAVGHTRTLTAANVNSASFSNDWTLLERQAGVVTNIHVGASNLVATNIDLIVKGTVDGQSRGFVYQPAAGNYKPDTTNLTVFTRVQLRAKILAGDTLTLVGVPPGSGTRMGIDCDEDGVRDGDEPVPSLRIARDAGGLLVRWPTNAPSCVLEQTGQLPPVLWSTETSVRGVVGTNYVITNMPAASQTFFRLRRL